MCFNAFKECCSCKPENPGRWIVDARSFCISWYREIDLVRDLCRNLVEGERRQQADDPLRSALGGGEQIWIGQPRSIGQAIEASVEELDGAFVPQSVEGPRMDVCADRVLAPKYPSMPSKFIDGLFATVAR